MCVGNPLGLHYLQVQTFTLHSCDNNMLYVFGVGMSVVYCCAPKDKFLVNLYWDSKYSDSIIYVCLFCL